MPLAPTVLQPFARDRSAKVGDRRLGGGELFIIAGPCVLETPELTKRISGELAELSNASGVPIVFKASFDKANRSSVHAGRGPGMDEGLDWLAEVRERTGLPVLTDVHLPEHCARAAEAVDVLQVPAFLCRQTDLLVAAGETGKTVNVKKGQFLAPWDMPHVAEKVRSTGNGEILVTERGTTFGYGRLVVDMGGLRDMASTGAPVIFDATHAVQEPSAGGKTGGDRTKVPTLARAALATGFVDGLFFEVHPDPMSSPSDGPNMVPLEAFSGLVGQLSGLWNALIALP